MSYDLLLIDKYVAGAREPIKEFCLANKRHMDTARHRTHPGAQSRPGGFKLHVLQVITKALELNQSCDERELIDCILVHDLRGCEALPLTDAQRMAIAATKGQATYGDWRQTPHYKFVVLVLIADMWSAFINDNDL